MRYPISDRPPIHASELTFDEFTCLTPEGYRLGIIPNTVGARCPQGSDPYIPTQLPGSGIEWIEVIMDLGQYNIHSL